MSNTDMQANRFGRWAVARKIVAKIKAHLQSGGVVVIANHLKATYYTKAAHAAQFEARKSGAYVTQGKSMICFDGCAVKFGRKA